MAWTDEMVDDLRTMWKQGMTTAEIGKKLGVSKNSIVGKVHRLGLSGRPSPIKKKDEVEDAKQPEEKKAPKEKHVFTEKPIEAKAEKVAEKAKPAEKIERKEPKKDFKKNCQLSELEKNPRAVSLMELDNHTCRWPVGDPKDENFHFCGRKVRIGQTYCDEHSSVAYVKPGKLK